MHEIVVRFGSPAILIGWKIWAFLLVPPILAALGAWLGRGSWARILGAAVGAGLRDLTILVLLLSGVLTPTNPEYHYYFSLVLLYLCAAPAMVGATLAPYRGPIPLINSFLGAFLGQFILIWVVGPQKSKR